MDNRQKFKLAQSEAKKLKKKNPKLTHQQALKQAFAIVYKKHPAKKVAVKKVAKKKTAKKKVSGIKKPATKSIHKDTKSHNVRISVVSGIKLKTSTWYKVKPFTLSQFKAMHKHYFRPGYKQYFGIKKEKLIVSDKLNCQVYLQKISTPFSGIHFTARNIFSDGAFVSEKIYYNINELEKYVGKHVNF